MNSSYLARELCIEIALFIKLRSIVEGPKTSSESGIIFKLGPGGCGIGGGIVKIHPTPRRFGFNIPFASTICEVATPYLTAMVFNVSP
jgi:hypothetical protein